MITATATLDPVVVDLLRDAAAWRLLGRLFECPSSAWRDDIAALDRELADDRLHAAVTAALDESSEGLYHSVFGPGGPAPPREVTYYQSLELGSVMSSVTGYYGAFAYTPAISEPPDHIAVEVGFLAYLRTKQAFALLAGDADRATLAAEAVDHFRQDHVAAIAARLAPLLEAAPASYMASAGRILLARAGAPRGPKQLPVIQPFEDEDGSEFSCHV